MSAIDHLRTVGRGETPPDDGLLGNARCGWGRGELLGEEAILAAFCTRPFADDDAIAVESARGAALLGRDDALLADVYSGRIGRMWRVGRGIALPPEPAIDISFDPDMHQQRGDVLFRAEDHPELSAAGATWVLEGAQGYVGQLRKGGALRSRAFIMRAFADTKMAAALLAVYTMSNETSRAAAFSYAILTAAAQGGTCHVVGEESPPRPWNPRF